VIGINTAVSVDGQAVGFAIPINQVKRAIEDVKTIGYIARPWIGVRYVFVRGENAKPPFTFGAKLAKGNAASEDAVIKNSPAEEAGLKEHDIIIAVDGVEFEQGKALAELIAPHRSGDKIKVQYIRDGKLFDTTIVLGEAKQEKK
jgi:S1-C subfamily serine protease